MDKRDDVHGVDREVRRVQSRLQDEEKRIHEKKQELSTLEHAVREAQTLLSQTYDSMHVERSRALKELEQLEDVKVQAQHAVHRARQVRPEYIRETRPISESEAEPAASVSPQAAAGPSVKQAVPSSALLGDVSDLRASVERLREQSKAALQM